MDFSTAACAALITLSPVDPAFQGTHVVHTIPGRVRLRIPALRTISELTGSLEALLRVQPGITGVSVNRWCDSLTVTYDPSYWTSDAISAFLQQLHRDDIAQYEVVPPMRDTAEPSWMTLWIHPLTCWRVAGVLTLILGIILFALPMIPGGTPLLFLSTVCFSKAAEFPLAA